MKKKQTNSNISRLFKEYHYVLIINYAKSSEMTLVLPTNYGYRVISEIELLLVML